MHVSVDKGYITLYDVIVKKLERNSSTPLYEQLINDLQEDIKNKVYEYGDQIPAEPELEELYGVSRIVVRKAIKILEEKGLVIKRPGKGTFISYPKVVESFEASGSFTQSCIKMGIVPKTEVISKSHVSEDSVPKDIRLEMNYEKLILVERLRYADNQAVIFEMDYFIPEYDFLLDVDLTSNPIMSVVRENTSLIASYFEDIVEIEISDSKLNDLFGLEESEPLLKVTQKVLTRENELIYINIQYIRSSIYQYAVRHGGL